MTGIWLGLAVIGGVFAGPAAIVLFLAGGALLWYGRQWDGWLWALVVGLAVAGAVRAGGSHGESHAFPDSDIVAVRGTVDSVLETRGATQSFLVVIREVSDGDDWQPLDGRLYVTAGVIPTVGRGDQIYLSGSFESVADVAPGFGGYLSSIGAMGSGFARRIEVDQVGSGWRRALDDVAAAIRDRLQAAVPGDKGVLLSGFVTGDDARLSHQRAARFIATGTTHLTAVSGANLALLVFIASSIGRRAGWGRWSPWLIGTAVLFWAYAVLVGLGAPVVRAAIVATFAVVAPRLGRRPDFVTLIVLAAAFQAFIQPGHVNLLAYQLSAVSSLALVLALGGQRPAGLFGWLKTGIVATCAAQVATLVVLVPEFGTISVMSIPANVMIAPAAQASFVLAALASAAFPLSDAAGTAIATAAGIGAGYIVGVVDVLGGSTATNARVGSIGLFGRIILVGISLGGVTVMSAEWRLTLRRWYQQVARHPDACAIVAGCAVVGAALGALAAALL